MLKERIRYTDLLNRPDDQTTDFLYRLDVLEAELDATRAALTTETTLRATQTTALAQNVAVLSASSAGVSATVQILEDAFIDTSTTPPTAIARYGFNLSAGDVVTSMQAIAQDAPGAPISQIRFNADLQSENYVAGSAGWQITGAGSAEFEDGLFRGVFDVGTGAQRLYIDENEFSLGKGTSYTAELRGDVNTRYLVFLSGATEIARFGLVDLLGSRGAIYLGDSALADRVTTAGPGSVTAQENLTDYSVLAGTGLTIVNGTIQLDYAATAINLSVDDTHCLIKVTAACTVTLPTAASISGRMYTISALADNVILACTGVETINGDATVTLYTDESLTVFSDGTNWIVK